MVVCFPVGVITSDWNLNPFLDKFTNSSLNIHIYSICSQDPKYKINCLISFMYGWLKIRLIPTRITSSSELEIKSFVISKHFWSNFEFGIFCDISWEPKLLKKSLYCSLLNNNLYDLCSTYLSIFLLVSFQARDKILLLFKTFSIKQFMSVFNVILRQYWL